MSNAFDFVQIELPPKKPRSKSVTEIRGPYYTAVSYGYLKHLLDDWSEYIDGYKFAGGSMRLLKKDKVRRIIELCHEHDVYVSTGGFVERVIVQGEEAVDRYIEECKSLGFDVIEVSSGLAPIPLSDKLEIVKSVQRAGLKAKPEVSIMLGAGAGTHVVGYEQQMKIKSYKEFAKEVSAHLKLGVQMIMIESEGLTEDLPPEKWKKDVIKRLVDEFGREKLMFEASDPPVFKWYLTTFGRDVNLFVDHSQIVEFTAWKTGLWGDPAIWQGKKLSYHSQK
ncbi:phosphosulfolactate synthase [Candidatus Marsarchaeota G2 archaeon ECH_B_SAG-G06]|uniref:Phosphosulfolactate synthase n=1 Tax=Candidatus Marsarchaeota G2 archaeon ECH_B_SAG-G06 TaxID=1978166 RepID=A0A2R6C380_9ARCH|nr:MAG: phosphosulfolactate synthase [Candidatus Marsarchaeota G2 archaeon ECH_B_SAG-G06]